MSRGVAHGRIIQHGDGSRHISACFRVEGLPKPEDLIDHGVVEEEGRVVDGGEEVRVFTIESVVSSRVCAWGQQLNSSSLVQCWDLQQQLLPSGELTQSHEAVVLGPTVELILKRLDSF